MDEDNRYLEFIWDKPTNIYKSLQRYFKQNSVNGTIQLIHPSKVHNFSRVDKDKDLGILTHKLVDQSYQSTAPLPNATHAIKGFATQIIKENNGRQMAVIERKYRIDLGTLSSEITKFFSSPKFMFLSPELDSKKEYARAILWLGRDFLEEEQELNFGQRIALPREYLETPKGTLVWANVRDCRLSHSITEKISGILKELDVETDFGNHKEDTVNIGIPENLSPIMFRQKTTGLKNFDYLAQFAPYSFVELVGNPLEVRKSIIRLLSICKSERNNSISDDFWLENNLSEKVPSGSGHIYLKPQNLMYHQWMP